MKVKDNIIDTWCILMSETVIVLSLMMMTAIVSEESLARDTHTHSHTHTHTHTYTHWACSSSAKKRLVVCPVTLCSEVLWGSWQQRRTHKSILLVYLGIMVTPFKQSSSVNKVYYYHGNLLVWHQRPALAYKHAQVTQTTCSSSASSTDVPSTFPPLIVPSCVAHQLPRQ